MGPVEWQAWLQVVERYRHVESELSKGNGAAVIIPACKKTRLTVQNRRRANTSTVYISEYYGKKICLHLPDFETGDASIFWHKPVYVWVFATR